MKTNQTNQTTIRQAIQNTNILLDSVYQYALQNPNEIKNKNFIDWEGRSGITGILSLIFFNDKLYVRSDYKTRIVKIESLVLKFKMKKVKHKEVSIWTGYTNETLSVVSIELIQGKEYLDLTLEEFKQRVKEQKKINKTEEEK